MDRVSAELVDGEGRPLTGNTFSEQYIEAMRQPTTCTTYRHLAPAVRRTRPLPHDERRARGVPAAHQPAPALTSWNRSIGPEIYSNPVQHTRIKPPVRHLPGAALDGNIAAALWHQDSAVIDDEADGTDMLTVWLAVTDATIENGCLIVERASHREELTLHCPGKVFPAEIYIPESIIDGDRVIPMEVKAGGAVLLHKMTEHGSLDNHSDDIRWSFDLRYQPIGQPTGRSVFPGFVARSNTHPEEIITDPDEWAALWWQARDRIAGGEVPMYLNARWEANARQPICA